MCQTSIITNRVERLSKRSYSHRLDVATPNRYHVTQLVRLNRELDSLYEFIYDDWRTITEEDYKMFGYRLSSSYMMPVKSNQRPWG